MNDLFHSYLEILNFLIFLYFHDLDMDNIEWYPPLNRKSECSKDWANLEIRNVIVIILAIWANLEI